MAIGPSLWPPANNSDVSHILNLFYPNLSIESPPHFIRFIPTSSLSCAKCKHLTLSGCMTTREKALSSHVEELMNSMNSVAEEAARKDEILRAEIAQVYAAPSMIIITTAFPQYNSIGCSATQDDLTHTHTHTPAVGPLTYPTCQVRKQWKDTIASSEAIAADAHLSSAPLLAQIKNLQVKYWTRRTDTWVKMMQCWVYHYTAQSTDVICCSGINILTLISASGGDTEQKRIIHSHSTYYLLSVTPPHNWYYCNLV